MSDYKEVQSNEKELTAAIQGLNWVDSFAAEILRRKPDIKRDVDGLNRYKFAAYSGINQPGFLGKFFYIARYVDEIAKATYEAISDGQESSPIKKKNIDGMRYDKKPWTVPWSEIPQYTKDHIFINRQAFCTNYNNVINTPKLAIAKPDDGRETPLEYKARVLNDIGKAFDMLSGDVNKKMSFMRAAATAGTGTTIVQAQEGGKTYIQGYTMNILELDSPQEGVQNYYATAVDNNMGLLSGPSGTSHRVSNLVKEVFGEYSLTIKIKTAALCLAALGVPYNCHSFYEIVTVVLPGDTQYHTVGEFRKQIDMLGR